MNSNLILHKQKKNKTQNKISFEQGIVKINIKFVFIVKKQIKMNKRQQELFLSFFQELHETEQLIDRLKIDLTLLEGYNPHLLFDIISTGNDQITIEQMRIFLTQRMACNQRQLYDVFERFDWSRNGFISREDFVREISPFGHPPININHRKGDINTQIQGAFIALFIQILKRFRIIDVSRKQIVFIQPYDAFSHLDYWKKGIIGLGQLQKFYRDNDFQINQKQLYFLLHALRRRCYRDVNLQVFCENLNPLEFGQYPKFGNQIVRENQRQFLNRSRLQEQAIRRSRIDNQKFQHQIQRNQRRKQAEIQRQLNLQERINSQLLNYDRKQQLNVRRALLEDEINIRNTAVVRNQLFQRQNLRSIEESRRLIELEALREQQRLVTQNLKRSVLKEEAQLQASRRQAMIQRELALQQQLQRDRQARRVISRARQFELSRREPQFDAIRQRQLMLRDIELQRLRQSQRAVLQSQPQQFSRSIKKSRIQQLQKQLQKTRAQMRQRKSRLDMQDKFTINKQSAKKSTMNGSPY